MAPGDSGTTDSDRRWAAFVDALSTQPYVIHKLMTDHLPDAGGLCRACTTPGRGTTHVKWPCSMYSLGQAAQMKRGKS